VTTPETNGPGEPTRQVSVSTAPPSAPRRWWSAVPHHLGRARTSTVVLALLFVGVYTLYLHVRPPDPVVAPAQESTVQTPVTPAPAETAEPTPPAATSAPTTTADPGSAPPAGTGEEAPAESAEPAPTTAGDETRAPTPPTAAPTATAAPTVTAAPGT
jgi:hypothetical protein